MARCIDCIHSEMCYWKADFVNPNTCAHFKDKSEVAPKSEVAREIFADIENNMIDIKMEFSTLRAIGSKTLAKLKKKHTEGTK